MAAEKAINLDDPKLIELDDKAQEVLKDLPPEKCKKILSLLIKRTEICRQGPIPSPEGIAFYN